MAASFNPSRRELFEVMREKEGEEKSVKSLHVRNHVLAKMHISDVGHETTAARLAVSRYCNDVHTRWAQSSRNYDIFIKKNANWLDKRYYG